MMKRLKMAGAGVVLALLSGCATVEMSSSGAMTQSERQLVLQSNGYALANLIPICSGTVNVDAKGKPTGSIALFQERTTTSELYAKAQAVAKAQNCELTNVVFTDNYQGIDAANFYGLFTVYDVTLSAVLKQK